MITAFYVTQERQQNVLKTFFVVVDWECQITGEKKKQK